MSQELEGPDTRGFIFYTNVLMHVTYNYHQGFKLRLQSQSQYVAILNPPTIAAVIQFWRLGKP